MIIFKLNLLIYLFLIAFRIIIRLNARKEVCQLPKTTNNRFSEEREHMIMDLLRKNGRITIDEITDALGISPSTARLQLRKMNDNGMLLRTHGGAVQLEQPISNQSGKVNVFENIINADKKRAIAEAAIKTIKDGDFIALSSGTTTLILATMLHSKKNLTVVTDAVPIANELFCDPNIRLYVCGGEIQRRNGACLGPSAEEFLSSLRVDRSYCSVDSIDMEFGITSVDIDPRSERALCHSGKECYILADSTKFRVKPFIEKIIGLEEISYLISDSSLEQKYIDHLRNVGVQVIIGEIPPIESVN